MKFLLPIAMSAAFAALSATATFAADDYPSEPIRIVVPFPPGGSVNVLARLFGDALTQAWGQPTFVDPKPGAGGVVASGELARAPADGHTLMMATANVAIAPSLFSDIPFNTEEDLLPVVQTMQVPGVFLVRADLGVNTLAELIEMARSNPGELNYSSGGTGSIPHLGTELLLVKAEMEIEHIPYPGNAPALLALLAGDVDMMQSNVGDVLQYINDGTLIPLAVNTPERVPQIPDVPTVAELGIPDYSAVGWHGFFAPAGTPQPIVDKINKGIQDALQTPEISNYFSTFGYIVRTGPPEEFAELVKSDIQHYAIAVEVSGATAQ